MDFQRVTYEKVEGVFAKVTMNLPEKRNATDSLMLEELMEAFKRADADDDIRVIILAGAGQHFCAGHNFIDLGASKDPRGAIKYTYEESGEARLKREDYTEFKQGLALRNVSKITLAMVQGYCGGAILGHILCMCDLIVAADDARFSNPAPRYGTTGSELLAEVFELGAKKAKEMLLTGLEIDAKEAQRLGLVNRVVPREKLEEETLQLARRIAEMDPFAATLIKRCVNGMVDILGYSAAYEYSFMVHLLSHDSQDLRKRMKRALEAYEEGGSMQGILPRRVART